MKAIVIFWVLISTSLTYAQITSEGLSWYYTEQDSVRVDSLTKKFLSYGNAQKKEFIKSLTNKNDNRIKTYFVARVFVTEKDEGVRNELIRLYESQHCEEQMDGLNHLIIFSLYNPAELSYEETVNLYLLISLVGAHNPLLFNSHQQKFIKLLKNKLQSRNNTFPCYD